MSENGSPPPPTSTSDREGSAQSQKPASVEPIPSPSAEATGKSPATVYQLMLTMEEVHDKLRMLKYEVDMGKSRKAFAQHYFAMANNPGEQGIPVDFAPAKLKSGAGEQVVYALDKLTELALTKTRRSWQMFKLEKEVVEDDTAVTDDAEITAEQFDEDDVQMADDDDEDGDNMYFDLHGSTIAGSGAAASDESRTMIRPVENAAEWAQEVERVVPSLKVVIRHDAKDWRAHVEQMQTHNESIGDTLVVAKTQLGRLAADIKKSLDKIGSREKYLNSQLSGVLQTFRHSQDALAETKQKYSEASGGVTERQRRLADMTDELDGLKQQMEERGANLTDGAPLVKLKQSMARLEAELVEMDVVMGVIEQSLLQAQLRDNNVMHMAHNVQKFTL